MKIWIVVVVLSISLMPGCEMLKGDGKVKVEPSSNTGTTVSPTPWGSNPNPPEKSGAQPAIPKASRGKVAHVDAALGFVVIDFTFSALPAAGLRFGVFRNGLRIGEITTTKMVDEAFQVADINKGDIRMGDDVRLD